MGYSKVELANQALSHIGKDSIASLSDNTATARIVNAAFNRSIHEVLARSDWTFARKIAPLAGLTNDWDERWGYKYDIPNDAISPVRLVPRHDIPNTQPIPYQQMGGAIYTNELDAKLEYVQRTEDTMVMPQEFLTAASFNLARNVVMPLTRKMSFWEALQQQYEYFLGLAIEADSGNEPTRYMTEDSYYLRERGAGIDSDVDGAAPDGSIYWS